MNSIYGFLGAEAGLLPCKAAAAAVTATGRRMILQTKQFVEQTYGASVIYGDTDSVFLTLADADLSFPDVFRLGREMAATASALFPPPILLEFEKVYYPLLLVGKKHYTGMKYEDPDKPGKVDVKGLACIRKDICPFLRERCMKVINLLLAFSNQQALAVARTAAVDLLSANVPLDQLILSRQLADEYKTDKHAHVQVARLIEQRNPGAKPVTGDRVAFVYVESGDRQAKGYERAEDPDWVASHPAVHVDKLQYFEHQLRSQLGGLFSTVMAEDPFDTPEIQALLTSLVEARADRERAFQLKKNRQRTLVACGFKRG